MPWWSGAITSHGKLELSVRSNAEKVTFKGGKGELDLPVVHQQQQMNAQRIIVCDSVCRTDLNLRVVHKTPTFCVMYSVANFEIPTSEIKRNVSKE